MRTFHIGGTASRSVEQSFYKAKNDGIIKYHQLRVVAKGNEFIVLNRNGSVSINNEFGREFERYLLPQGASIKIPDGSNTSKDKIFVTWDPYTVPIITEVKGVVNSEDLIADVTVQEESNPITGVTERVVVEHKQEYHPQIIITDEKKEIVGIYSIPIGAHILVDDKQEINAGDLIAKIPRGAGKTRDITGGLPRVAEIFEARKPKDPAVISEIDGVVEFGEDKKGRRTIIVRNASEISTEYLIPHGKHPNVYKGDRVFAGQQLTDGPVVPHDILRVCGDKVLQEYLLNEVQEVYRLQGVRINDKHIELIISQMLKKVRIENSGDTHFLIGEQINRMTFKKVNEEVLKKKGKPAQATPLLLGITRVSLTTESFISSASFQETTRVLTEAAASGKVDLLCGLKENVIVGHLIPAGTGLKQYQKVEMIKYADDTATDSKEQNTEKEEK
jgi:DNA-directed RNA polymerase subunit beta'